MQYYYKQPEYFQKFRCIGGDCGINCCDCSWDIYWTKKEVDHLFEAEMSDEFRAAAKKQIIPDPKIEDGSRYKIQGTDDQRCPFHNKKTGLCDIQKELGEEYLSHTCKVYPRWYLKIDNTVLRFCAASCPALIKQLMHDKKAATLETIPIRECNFEAIAYDPPRRLESFPYLRYRIEIIDLFSYIFTSKLSFDTSMLVGPIFAKNISESSEKDKGIRIPAMIGMAKEMCSGNEPDLLAENIKADYSSKLILGKFLMGDLSQYPVNISVLCTENKLDPEKYSQGKEIFFSEIHNPDIALKNIAMNVFLDLFCGQNFKERSFFTHFSYFTICMATICLLGYTAAYTGGEIERNFINSVALLGRRTVHMDPTKVFDRLEGNGITKPEQLAAFIK